MKAFMTSSVNHLEFFSDWVNSLHLISAEVLAKISPLGSIVELWPSKRSESGEECCCDSFEWSCRSVGIWWDSIGMIVSATLESGTEKWSCRARRNSLPYVVMVRAIMTRTGCNLMKCGSFIWYRLQSRLWWVLLINVNVSKVAVSKVGVVGMSVIIECGSVFLFKYEKVKFCASNERWTNVNWWEWNLIEWENNKECN